MKNEHFRKIIILLSKLLKIYSFFIFVIFVPNLHMNLSMSNKIIHQNGQWIESWGRRKWIGGWAVRHLTIQSLPCPGKTYHSKSSVSFLVTMIGYGLLSVIVNVWPQGYKTFFMLNSAEHEIYPAHKC